MAFYIGNQEVSEAEWLKRNAAATGAQQVGTQRWLDSSTQLAQQKAAAAGTQLAQIPGVNVSPLSTENLPASYGGKTYKPVGTDVMFGAYKDPTTSQVVGEQFKAEGIYEKIGTYSATQDGVTTPGTLWKSSTGFYQFVDPSGQTIMSGSSGAPLPKLEALSAKEIESLGKWKQWNTGIPTKPEVPASEALAIPQKKDVGTTLYPSDRETGVSAWKTPSTQESSPFDSGEDVFKYSYKPKSAINATAANLTESETIPTVKETPASGIFGTSNLFNTTISSRLKTPYKTYGEYRLYDDGSVTDKYGNKVNLPATATQQIGAFGRKHEMRRNRAQCHKMHEVAKKNTGFAGLYKEAKEDVTKKVGHKDVAKGILWSGITFGPEKKEKPETWAHFALENKKMTNVKKPVTKLVSQQKVKKDTYGSAWEQVLFSKKTKNTEKKRK